MGPSALFPVIRTVLRLAAASPQDSLLGPQALEQRLRSLFDRVAPFTVGAEEELLLIDAQTLLPAPAAEYALALGAGDRRLAGELRSAQVEAMTPVCVSVADVARELASIRRLVSRGLGPDVLVVGTGAHALTRDPGPSRRRSATGRIAADHPWAARNVLDVRAARPRRGERRRPRARRLQRAAQLPARAARARRERPVLRRRGLRASPPCARS